jgi:hypothetical protein
MPLSILPDYPGNREYLPEFFSWWNYNNQAVDNLSMEGFRRYRMFCIEVFSDALALEGVPTRVTRVANKYSLKYHLYFLCV